MKQVKFVDVEGIELDMFVRDKKIRLELNNPDTNNLLQFELEKYEVEEIIYELIRLKKQL